MLEKYNREITKIAKLMAFIFIVYIVLLNIPTNVMNKMDIAKSSLMIGIVYMVIDGYYPNVDYE